mmetsp:Transcript_1574/g.3856  ORF Transcript_1574/g.3856 Transcript_1574/m.3856 type:complete len:213 (-) Transcript_1574:1558-2196(-)
MAKLSQPHHCLRGCLLPAPLLAPQALYQQCHNLWGIQAHCTSLTAGALLPHLLPHRRHVRVFIHLGPKRHRQRLRSRLCSKGLGRRAQELPQQQASGVPGILVTATTLRAPAAALVHLHCGVHKPLHTLGGSVTADQRSCSCVCLAHGVAALCTRCGGEGLQEGRCMGPHGRPCPASQRARKTRSSNLSVQAHSVPNNVGHSRQHRLQGASL